MDKSEGQTGSSAKHQIMSDRDQATYENSLQYLEKLRGRLKEIEKCDVDSKYTESDESSCIVNARKRRQARRRKTIHTTHTSDTSITRDADKDSLVSQSAVGDVNHEPSLINQRQAKKEAKEEILFRNKDDFALLNEDSEITQEKVTEKDQEKVYITKKEIKYLEDIGSLASKTRIPLDDKQQRFFEKDKKKFQKVELPETQEYNKSEILPREIISKTKETPSNITSTELDGLKGYLLQLKELIARRETAWAKTTEKDYSQRVELTKFKNEVSHLRMLCDKRTREIREKDKLLQTKDEEIKELNKKIQSLKNASIKNEKRESETRVKQSDSDSRPKQVVNQTEEDKRATTNPFVPFALQKNRNSVSFKPKEENIPRPEGKTKDDSQNPTGRVMKSSVLKQLARQEELLQDKTETKVSEQMSRIDEQLRDIEETLTDQVTKGSEKKKPWKTVGRQKVVNKVPEYRTQINGRPLPKKGLTSGSTLKPKESNLGVLVSENGMMKGVSASTTRKRPNIFNAFQGPASIFQQSFFKPDFNSRVYPNFS